MTSSGSKSGYVTVYKFRKSHTGTGTSIGKSARRSRELCAAVSSLLALLLALLHAVAAAAVDGEPGTRRARVARASHMLHAHHTWIAQRDATTRAVSRAILLSDTPWDWCWSHYMDDPLDRYGVALPTGAERRRSVTPTCLRVRYGL